MIGRIYIKYLQDNPGRWENSVQFLMFEALKKECGEWSFMKWDQTNKKIQRTAYRADASARLCPGEELTPYVLPMRQYKWKYIKTPGGKIRGFPCEA